MLLLFSQGEYIVLPLFYLLCIWWNKAVEKKSEEKAEEFLRFAGYFGYDHYPVFHMPCHPVRASSTATKLRPMRNTVECRYNALQCSKILHQ